MDTFHPLFFTSPLFSLQIFYDFYVVIEREEINMSTNLKFKVRKVVSTIGWIYGISWRMLALIGMWYLLISLYVAIRF